MILLTAFARYFAGIGTVFPVKQNGRGHCSDQYRLFRLCDAWHLRRMNGFCEHKLCRLFSSGSML
jgi:hypothetical protein